MATIKDIAHEAGVSTATVSRVLNTPTLVSLERRKLVERVISEHNYSSNALARELVTKNTNLIGLLVTDITNTFVPAVMDSFSKELEKYNYNMFVCITGADPSREQHFIDIMRQKRVEGIVLIGNRPISSPNNAGLSKLAKHMPVLKIGYTDIDRLMSVRTDEELGTYKAVEYLIKLGHKRIAFLNGSENVDTYYCKKIGYEKAMRDYNLEPQEKYYIKVDSYLSGSGGYNGAMQLMSLNEKPTAIFTAGDQIAFGVYNAVQSCGYRIPDDISVVGFSGSYMSEMIYPSLTTVAQYALETGIEAARQMVKKLRKEGDVQQNIVFTPELILRKSCKPVE